MATSDGVKLCKDCKHVITGSPNDPPSAWECAKTKQEVLKSNYQIALSLVGGTRLDPEFRFRDCDLCRCPSGICGFEGKLWEAK